MDVKMKDIVRVVPYDPEWKNEFLKIKAMLVDCVGDLIISVDHVGSTAIEGLASKPIIDIDVVIDSYDVFPAVKDRLSKIGFEHVGNLDVEGEKFLKEFLRMSSCLTIYMYALRMVKVILNILLFVII
jgi:GrpB-like predicted nucleotidyltransferase (UPF0157 family)